MLLLQAVSFSHPNGDVLFEELNLSLSAREKIALVGRNGIGKSSLLHLIAGGLQPTAGLISSKKPPLFLEQITGNRDHRLVGEALGIAEKRRALRNILAGQFDDSDLMILNDDWDIEERCQALLQDWDLGEVDPERPMYTLSWGQQTRVGLASISIRQPEFVLLDEPSNHLDASGRKQLLRLIQEFKGALILVSHDRSLLNAMDRICELSPSGLSSYGGNYAFYETQKKAERAVLQDDIKDAEKAWRKAKDKERESRERQQKLDARGRRKQEQSGLPTISMNRLRNNAERSTAKMKEVHAGKVEGLFQEWSELRQDLPDMDQMRLALGVSSMPKGKLLMSATDIQYNFEGRPVWSNPPSLEIYSGERWSLSGNNGSGKSTLLRVISGELQPDSGQFWKGHFSSLYLDQDYSVIEPSLSVGDQARKYNLKKLQPHEVNNQLNRFLFGKEFWDRSCGSLSGGEKMRLMLCCLSISASAPDLIMLDEPTNNLDLLNLEILEQALIAYSGTLIVVSHDELFLERVGVEKDKKCQLLRS